MYSISGVGRMAKLIVGAFRVHRVSGSFCSERKGVWGVAAGTILNFEPQVRCFGPVLQPTNKMRQFATSNSLECTAERHVTVI